MTDVNGLNKIITALKGQVSWYIKQHERWNTMTTLTDYPIFESWVLRSYKILKKKHTPPSSPMLAKLFAFCVAAKTEFPFESFRFILISPSVLAVGGGYSDTGWRARGSQWNVQYAVKCCNMGKRRFFLGGPPKGYPIWCPVWYLRGPGTARKWKCKTWHACEHVDTFIMTPDGPHLIHPWK